MAHTGELRAMFSFCDLGRSADRGPAQGSAVFLSDSAMTSTCMWIAALHCERYAKPFCLLRPLEMRHRQAVLPREWFAAVSQVPDAPLISSGAGPFSHHEPTWGI